MEKIKLVQNIFKNPTPSSSDLEILKNFTRITELVNVAEERTDINLQNEDSFQHENETDLDHLFELVANFHVDKILPDKAKLIENIGEFFSDVDSNLYNKFLFTPKNQQNEYLFQAFGCLESIQGKKGSGRADNLQKYKSLSGRWWVSKDISEVNHELKRNAVFFIKIRHTEFFLFT